MFTIRSSMSVRLVIVLLAMLGGSQAVGLAQGCQPRMVDSAVVWRFVDSLKTGGPPARERGVQFRVVPVASARGCWTAVGIEWAGNSGGAIAILGPEGALSSLRFYPGVRDLRAAGTDRFAFSYQYSHGMAFALGVHEERFIVLCSFGTWQWAECVDVEELYEDNQAPDWTAPDGSAGLYTRRTAEITLRDDQVDVHRRVQWMLLYSDRRVGESHSIDLGTSIIRLP